MSAASFAIQASSYIAASAQLAVSSARSSLHSAQAQLAQTLAGETPQPLFAPDIVATLGKGEAELIAFGLAGGPIDHAALSVSGPPPLATSASPLARIDAIGAGIGARGK